MKLQLLIVASILVVWPALAGAATIAPARARDNKLLDGIKVEGEIKRGDAAKLRKLLETFDASTVYLRSFGGDVDEALQMGTLIRRLRIQTDAPGGLSRGDFQSLRLEDQRNVVCASACFLIWAGGVIRWGSQLALHMPKLPRDIANKLSDDQYETAVKREVARVVEYLHKMEIDRHLIDKMIATNSQDVYEITADEALSLDGKFSPSIEEVLLRRCNTESTREVRTEGAIGLKGERATPTERDLRTQLKSKGDSGISCEFSELQDVHAAAVLREFFTKH